MCMSIFNGKPVLSFHQKPKNILKHHHKGEPEVKNRAEVHAPHDEL